MGASVILDRLNNADFGVTRLARMRPRGVFASVVIGLLGAALALGIRLALSGFYGDVTGFMILIPGVILAALAGGRIAGVVATLACLAGGWIMIGPEAIGAYGPLGRISTFNFIVVGLFSTLVAASLRAALAGLEGSLRRIEETEGRFHLISEHAPSMLWMSDEAGRCIHLNAAQRAYWGVTDSDVGDGFDFTSTIHPDDLDRVRAVTMDAVQRQAAFTVQARTRRHDGVWRIINSEARPRFDATGYRGMIGVNVDITDAHAAQSALRESEARFRLMADTAPSPVWLTNADAQVEFVNEALVDFYGQPAEAILGHIWQQAIHPDDVEVFRTVQAEARPNHEPYAFEARFRRADGEWRWMRVTLKPRLEGSGAFLGYVGMSFDVTEARQAIASLEQQERRQTFLLALTDRLRSLSDPEAIMVEVERALGSELGAARVGYGEVDQDRGVVTMSRDWTAGVDSAQGQFQLDAFGADLITALATGQPVRISDVTTDPRTRDAADAFAAIQTRAIMRAPLIRGGRLRAFLYVHSAIPRDWTLAELELVEEVAARTWAEIESTRAEIELRESESRFRDIADTAPVLIWVTRENRLRAFVNQAYVAFVGGDYDSVLNADWRTYVHPDDHAQVVQASMEGEATRQAFSLEARYLRADGQYRWLKSLSRPRFGAGGEVVGFVGVAFDVTDIRESENRLTESEARFRTVADTAPALIWMSDEDAKMVFFNKRFESFFDSSASEWSAMVHPRDAGIVSAAFGRAFEQRDKFEIVFRVVHPQLGLRWMRSEGVPRYDDAGVFHGYVGANLDVTDAKRAEDDLKRINELLEERVGDALAEKAKAEADLMHAQRMEAVGRLTGGVAHDFNNLLTVVIGALDMMLRTNDTTKRRKLAEAALSAARRGEGLTHQLLAFSRRQALRPAAVDLNVLIHDTEPLLRRALGETNDFRLRLKRGGIWVNVDATQFGAALLNLVVNARDAIGDGGEVRVRTMNCSIAPGEVRELAPGDYVCVTVTDNGEGMSPEVMSRVFEPFFTTKAVGKGTGLGLSQVYGFARQSGGGVHIKSKVGKGAEIRLYLPPLLDHPEAATEVSTAAPAGASVIGRSILLVEDDAGVAAMAVDLLKEMGLKVEAVDNGPEALTALGKRRFDLMLTDIVMPGGMTGVELARRAAADWPDMQIVLTSGYAGDDVDEVMGDAPWPLLRKPYSIQQLRRLLSDSLSRTVTR
jgi:PAS domain S-box-containing protein